MARPEKKSGQKYWSGRGGGSPGNPGKDSPAQGKRAGGKDTRSGKAGPHQAKAGGNAPARSGQSGSGGQKSRDFRTARDPDCLAVLEKGLVTLGLEPALVPGIDTYLKELELWNPRLGLVEAGGLDLMIRHVLDSLALCRPVAAFLARQKAPGSLRIADLGSGGGFPALPLAVFLKSACPGAWSMDLFDRQARRTVFLQNCVAMLGLKGLVEVHQTLLEGMDQQTGAGTAGTPQGSQAAPDSSSSSRFVPDPASSDAGDSQEKPLRKAFDLVTARAFRPLDDLVLASMQDMLAPGGWICLMKARTDSIREELTRVRHGMIIMSGMDELPASAGAGNRNAWVLPLVVPGLDEERHLVFLTGK